jgi:hypothetical protein
MPVHIGEIHSEVSAVGKGQLPLSSAQIEHLVQLVIKRLAEKQRGAKLSREATELSREATPPLKVGG